jgi:hypothetical protein
MEYLYIIKDAFYFLFRALVVYLIYKVSRDVSSESKAKSYRLYLSAIIIAGILSWYSGYSYGTHIEDADPIYGGGNQITDIQISDKHKLNHGILIFVVVVTPALIGVWCGLRFRSKNILITKDNRAA